ncbi:MAG: hypothetical protein RL210_135 [Pseudomonadota bacterium]|jgi:hypothetical protein|nr:hypothetical protein [Pseudomonadota bacterium]
MSGLSRTPGKRVQDNILTGVRIPLSPPSLTMTFGVNRSLVRRDKSASMAGLPALQGSEPGQVRKEAATAIYCKCRGSGSPPPLFSLNFSKNPKKDLNLSW